MKNDFDLFKSINWKELEKLKKESEKYLRSAVILDIAVVEDEIQNLARSNFGRELTDVELNRITKIDGGWGYFEEFSSIKYDMILSAIRTALDNTNNGWRLVDEDFLKEKTGKLS